MYKNFRSLLFKLEPERAHQLTLGLLRLGGLQPFQTLLTLLYYVPARPINVFGLHFRNPVGLAAGYDKDAVAVKGLSALGFGHLEVGTVTPLPQAGNPQPRLFRLVEDEAIINRLGFPGVGAVVVAKRLRKLRHSDLILGVNLGRNKNTANEQAVFDYLALLQNFAPLADYLTINVSSPNTVGLRRLQGREALEGLLSELHHQRRHEQTALQKRLPLLVKLAPDLSEAELDGAVEAVLRTHMDGIIVTNTTLARPGLKSPLGTEAGGLSGRPLAATSDAVLSQVVKRVEGKLPVVGVGGIMTPDDARRKLDLGAALVQVYSGLVYAGPGLVRKIVRSL